MASAGDPAGGLWSLTVNAVIPPLGTAETNTSGLNTVTSVATMDAITVILRLSAGDVLEVRNTDTIPQNLAAGNVNLGKTAYLSVVLLRTP